MARKKSYNRVNFLQTPKLKNVLPKYYFQQYSQPLNLLKSPKKRFKLIRKRKPDYTLRCINFKNFLLFKYLIRRLLHLWFNKYLT